MRCIDLLGGAAVAAGGVIPAYKMERVPAIATSLHYDKLIIRRVLFGNGNGDSAFRFDD